MLKLRRGKPPFTAVPLGGGAFIRVRPATQTDVEEAGARAQRILVGLVAGSDAAPALAEVLGEDFNLAALEDRDRLVAASTRLAEIYLVLCCQDGWTGVGTEDGEAIDAPDEATMAMLLTDPARRNSIMRVVETEVHQAVQEKNASAASLNGGADTQTGAPTAGDAGNPAPTDATSKAKPASAPAAQRLRTRH